MAGIFSKPGSLGIFSGGLGLGSLGGVVEDQIDRCVKNMVAGDYDEAWAKDYCTKFTTQAVDCAPKCASYRQDSPEWANCIQKCHGYTPVDYSKEKSDCTAKGMIYSWLEGGCVSKEKYDSCPSGTVYAKYQDGSEKCIGIPTDLTTTKCPAGTKLQNVSGGQACVSPVVPGAKKTPTPTVVPGTTTQVQPVTENTAGIPILVALAAVAAAAGLYMYNKKKQKQEGDTRRDIPKIMTRANCGCGCW